jgi:hypothetical protein
MFRTVLLVSFLGCGVAICGCAKKPEDVAAAYISPLQYDRYSCRQLAEEAQRISVRVGELSGVQRQKRTGDMLATTAAVVIFWPAAFMVGGDDAQTAELARMKGEFETIQKVAIQKNCGLNIQVQPAQPAPPKDDFKPFS